MFKRKAQHRVHQRRRGHKQQPRVRRLAAENFVRVLAVGQVHYGRVHPFAQLGLHSKPPLLVRAEPVVLRAFAGIGKYDARVLMRLQQPRKQRRFGGLRFGFKHHARLGRMLKQFELGFERFDAGEQLVRQNVGRKAVHMQVFQKRVAERQCAVAVEIDRFKANQHRVVVRRVGGGVELGNQLLLDTVEPLVLARFGKLDIPKHALFRVRKERIVALDGGIVFVVLRHEARNLRLKRARFEVF